MMLRSERWDRRPLSKVARLRNIMLDIVADERYDYVLWLDSDLVDYPPDLPTRVSGEEERSR